MRSKSNKGDKQHKRFLKLPEDWRMGALSKKTEEINAEIRNVAVNDIQLEAAKKMDVDLAQKKEAAKVAGEQYSEGHKMNKIKLEFLIETLRSRGENVVSAEEFLRKVADEEAVDG